MTLSVRPPRPDELDLLRVIEVEAGRAFASIGMPEVAADDPPSLDELARHLDAGRLWVAIDADGAPLGYVVARSVGGRGHVEQVSVKPDHQGRGIGRALIAQVDAWAAARGLTALTLSTFRDVAWNAPLYEHLGFRVLADHELDDALRAERRAEQAHGLDVTVRVFMRRDLPVDPV